jgi:hypothetical protein
MYMSVPPSTQKLCVQYSRGDPLARRGLARRERAGERADGYAPAPMTCRLALALALLLAAAGCRRDLGPAERYQAFAAAARSGDADAVWSMLSERSRDVLDARAREIASRAPPGVVAGSGRQLVVGDLSARTPRPKAVVLRRESRERAVVAVEVEGEPAREVTLVREGGVWRVDLPFDN